MTHEKTKIWLAVCALLASMPAFVLGIGMISQISAGFAGIFWGAAYGVLLSVVAGLSAKAIIEEMPKLKKSSTKTSHSI